MENEWRDWMYCRPPNGFLVQVVHWPDEPFVTLPEDLPKEFNVAGLCWRFSGIGRMRFESLSPESQGQLLSCSLWGQMANALMPSGGGGILSQLLGTK